MFLEFVLACIQPHMDRGTRGWGVSYSSLWLSNVLGLAVSVTDVSQTCAECLLFWPNLVTSNLVIAVIHQMRFLTYGLA